MHKTHNIIIGTAGHVDHGKTNLIQALTGIDTDRLAEEKKRGITIELGFAWLDLPDGSRAGIVDVPGHERFIANMLAGAGGIDLALLIIAADEGVMPQTVEHLHILSLLGIDRGIVVITKCDLVDEEWLMLVKEDVAEFLKGTFLENAPIHAVSSHTGMGIDELRQEIARMAAKIPNKRSDGTFRLSADRVFTMEGFGTVVTGTLIDGDLALGSEVMIYPAGTPARVRGIQVHSQPAEEAHPGQRVAVNLAGIKKSEISRGDILAPAGSLSRSMMLDVRLSVLADSPFEIKNGSRVHFYQGARTALCKVILLDRETLPPGQTAYAQLRFEEEVSLKPGDRFVVRFYSPLLTIGGGLVLDPDPRKHKRNDPAVIEGLEIRESGTLAERLSRILEEQSGAFLPLDRYALRLGAPAAKLRQTAGKLGETGELTDIGGNIWLHKSYVALIEGRLRALLDAFHKENPLKGGMRREELRARLLPTAPMAAADALLETFLKRGCIKTSDGLLALDSFEVQFSAEQSALTGKIEAIYREAGASPPATDELLQSFGKDKVKEATRVLSALITSGTLVRLDTQITMHRDTVAAAEAFVRESVQDGGEITLGAFRDRMGTSRKFAIALLELFDRNRITKKVGDVRVSYR